MKGWLGKAYTDFKILQVLINSQGELITDGVCFHSQQCVEKFLKCFLIEKNKKFDETHNLNYLRMLCIEIDSDFAKFDFDILRPYAVQIRYGNDLYVPSDKEALEAYNLATNLKNFVLEKLNVPESDLK
ncbi:MAG: HEPN domain-containing protein [Ignavibacteria bacterium]|nr:HEPN domain-containing protein [Ignavibacteria bacterium]